MFEKDKRNEEIARLESQFALTTESATTLYERGQAVEQIRQEAESRLGHPLPSAISNGFIEAFYKYAPELVVSIWKGELNKVATLENCTVLLQLQTTAYDLRDDTAWFSIDVRQGDDQIIRKVQVKLSPSEGLAEFAKLFARDFGTDEKMEALRQDRRDVCKVFRAAIFESVMERPSKSSLEVIGAEAGRWTFSAQCNLKMNLLVGLQEEGRGGWLPTVRADHQMLLTEDDPADRPLNPPTLELLRRRRKSEEVESSILQEISAKEIVAAFDSQLSMRDLLNPKELYDQLCVVGDIGETDSKMLVAIAYLRQMDPPRNGLMEWINSKIEEEGHRSERLRGGLNIATKMRAEGSIAYYGGQLGYSRYVVDALRDHKYELLLKLSAQPEE